MNSLMCIQNTGGRLGHKYFDYLTCIVLKIKYRLDFVYDVNPLVKPIFGMIESDISTDKCKNKKKIILNVRDKYNTLYGLYGTPYWTGLLEKDMDSEIQNVLNNDPNDDILLCISDSTRIDINSIANSNLFDIVVDEIRLRYGKNTELSKNIFNITLHIRRGDTIRTNYKYKWCYLDMDYYANNLKIVIKIFKKYNILTKPKINICTDSNDIGEFKYLTDSFSDLEFDIAGGDIYEDFDTLVNSHVLFVGNSSFSVIAGMIGKGIKIYNERNVFRIMNNKDEHIVSDCAFKENFEKSLCAMFING